MRSSDSLPVFNVDQRFGIFRRAFQALCVVASVSIVMLPVNAAHATSGGSWTTASTASTGGAGATSYGSWTGPIVSAAGTKTVTIHTLDTLSNSACARSRLAGQLQAGGSTIYLWYNNCSGYSTTRTDVTAINGTGPYMTAWNGNP